MKFSLIAVLIALNLKLYSQVTQDAFKDRIDSLKANFSNSFVENSSIELAFYTSISFYPELSNAKITVRFEPIETSMQCRPEFSSFWSFGRGYVIIVNSDTSSPIYPLNASFSALVGCIGHELSHIIRYEKQSKSEILSDGIKFLSNDAFRSYYEKETDKITVEKGLGFEQYEYAKYIFENPKLSSEYLEFKKKIYHSPEQLLSLYENHKSR